MTKILLIENGTEEFQKELESLAATKKISLKFLDGEAYEDYLFGEILKETDTEDTVDMSEIEKIFEDARNSI